MEYQHPNTLHTQPFEVIHAHDSKVVCDGGGGALGHPRVYLTIEQETGNVVCNYCSRMYVYDHSN
jgi:uncharacterized Zn-finger protein